MINLGDVVDVFCDLDGQPLLIPDNFSFPVKRKFKIIGEGNPFGKQTYIAEVHYNSPFGLKLSLLDTKNYNIMPSISSTDYPLIKCCVVLPESIVPKTVMLSNGMSCKKCNEYYPYAEPNQPDSTLICYSCRI